MFFSIIEDVLIFSNEIGIPSHFSPDDIVRVDAQQAFTLTFWRFYEYVTLLFCGIFVGTTFIAQQKYTLNISPRTTT